jgi:hypothetical protein
MGHNALNMIKPNKCWVSSGLYPQVIVVRFEREIHINTITVEASGVLELSLVIDRPGEHHPLIQFKDGVRECKTIELERMELVSREVVLRADSGVDDFLVVYDLNISGAPVNWDEQW